MAIDRQQVTEQLKAVIDPDLHKDIVSLGMVKNVAVCEGNIAVKVELTTPACPMKDRIQADIVAACRRLGPEVQQVNVEFIVSERHGTPQDAARQSNPLPNVRHVIAVGAGKGGVGKSTIAVNLAVGLARRQARVGLLDGDIYGPSAPTLLNLHKLPVHGTANTLAPFEVHGIKAMTLGKLVESDKPLIWRGPMAHGAFRQLATQTDWGELDYLIVDLPPGTGDVPLTLAQMLPLSGAVIVCTPQRVAQDDAVRAVGMFRQLDIPVLGVVENMSYFIGDDGKEYDIFGRGGAAAMAERLNLPLLGTIPIHMELRANSDAGQPLRNFTGNPKLAAQLEEMVDNVIRQIGMRNAMRQQPTLTIS